jgi:thioredoxin reductase (NADPH)
LLTAYSDTQAAIKAINDVQLDYYLLKPWDPPNEKLYPVLDELLFDWKNSYQPDFHGVRLIGYQYSPLSHELKDFLSGNLKPYQWIEAHKDKASEEWFQLYDLKDQDLPVAITADGEILKKPSRATLAKAIGMSTEAKEELYDLVIIGAGPAGLAAGVYAGSEGLNALLVEKRAPGGQAGTSSRIENYLGFPKGLSGGELTRRALTQAERFGVEFLSPAEIVRLETDGQYKRIELLSGEHFHTKAVVITTGVDYRKLPAKGADELTGAGVYYGAATTEAASCKNKKVYVVGGGNSAGQGAVYLSQFAGEVNILIRRPDLSSSMSSYLIDQIDAIDNIHLMPFTQVQEVHGDQTLTGLTLENIRTQEIKQLDADALFVFIGARPYTDWLGDNILRDEKGYVLTGPDLKQHPRYNEFWKEGRDPYLLESCQPGVFAAGDVRSGAMNRVASAVGEGAMAIKFTHEYLANA